MELQALTVKLREDTGKGPIGRLRRTGTVPAVLYGENKEPVSLSIDYREFQVLVHGKQGEHALVDLKIDDKPELGGPAMLKEVQHHPVRNTYMHADLMRIDLKKKIRTMVPIKLEGRAKGVIEGGLLDHQVREVEVECVPFDVPQFVFGQIEDLDIGHSLHVSELQVAESVTVLTPGDRSVVAVHAPRVVAEAAPAEEGVEGVEGETPGEGAEGATPAEGAESSD